MAWSLARPDWQDRIRAGTSLLPDLPLLDKKQAARATEIFNRLRLPDVVGQPLLAEAAGDWFREIVGALHGSIDRETGDRMVREVFLLVPKKNSKTSNGAALMETSLLVNRRPNAEFLLIAPTQQIAEIAFRQVEGMIGADAKLSTMMRPQSNIRKVTDLRNGATLQVKSFAPDVLTGVKPAGILVDELHVVSGNANADRVIGQLRGGLISQPEGFIVFITTQSERPPAGVFKAELDKARAIRDGRRTGNMLPVLYEFPDDMSSDATRWGDAANWWMVTPNRGRSITIDRLEEEYHTARETGEDELRRWASQHLNIEIGLNLRSDRWSGAEYWEQQADNTVTLDTLISRCEVIVPGVDGGGLDDLFGFVALGRDKDTKDWLVWSHAWCHISVLERRKSIAARLRDFQTAGELTIVDDALGDVSQIVEMIDLIKRSGKLAQVAVDPAGLGEFVDALAQIGVTEESGELVGAKQGYALMNAIKTAERKLANGTLWHSGSALMNWCVGNLKIEPTATAIRATKQNAGDAKIDPAMALFDAVTFMALNPEPAGGGPSKYETAELLMV